MKKQLLTKMMLAVAMLGAGSVSAWADEVTTFNFSGQTNESAPTLSGANHHKAANDQQVQVATNSLFGGKFAFQSVGAGNGFYFTTTQLVQFKGDRYFSILELEAGDKIEFTFSSADAGSSTDKHFTVENCGTSSTTNLSLTAGGDAITANTDLESGTAYYVLADGYVDFKTRKNVYFDKVVITKAGSSLPDMTSVWGQNFRSLGKEFQTEITTDGGACSYGKAVAGDAGYYYPSADDGTTAFTNENIGFYVAYNSGGNHRRWKLYNGSNGIYNVTSADNTIHIYNLVKGQIVKVEGSALPAGSGTLTNLTAYDGTNTRYYQVNANGTGTLTVEKQNYIYSIEVFNTSNEIIGICDYSTGYLAASSTSITLKPGDSYHYQFVNHYNGGSNWLNWHLPVKKGSDNSNILVLRADWYEDINGSTVAEHQRGFSTDAADYWANVPSKMDGVTVDMTVTFTTDKKFVMTSSNSATDATTWTYNFTSDNDNNVDLTGEDYLTVALSVNTAWLEILSEGYSSVSKTISAAGWATYCSPYALNLAGASAGLEDAYIVTGGADGVLTKTSVKDGTVAANTGLLLKGSEGTVIIPVVASGTDYSATNKLKGVTENTEIAANAGYVLMNDATYGLAFYKNANAFTVGANTAYLPASFASARQFFSLDGETTGVGASLMNKAAMDKEIYNLQGQRVAAPQKGLYIVSGKKVIIK